ncbi:hypothetical protein EYF80_004863 [Liparis tanakae]|uniref:Uncharacterized protein n=1 Tax=Liparis tanakae TaxID=230148 RepID=A0A4Z2J556_9TELE|nr:hypothetical protein EYF80_004863 [Liparis tanakae]
MLKMSQKIRHTSSTLKMEGIAPTRAFTTTCSEERTFPLCHTSHDGSMHSTHIVEESQPVIRIIIIISIISIISIIISIILA